MRMVLSALFEETEPSTAKDTAAQILGYYSAFYDEAERFSEELRNSPIFKFADLASGIQEKNMDNPHLMASDLEMIAKLQNLPNELADNKIEKFERAYEKITYLSCVFALQQYAPNISIKSLSEENISAKGFQLAKTNKPIFYNIMKNCEAKLVEMRNFSEAYRTN